MLTDEKGTGTAAGLCPLSRICDNCDVIQFRRLAALLMGAWLGAGLLTDVVVTQNFRTIDPFLQTPGNVEASAELNKIGRDQERLILRRNAAEENTWIFRNWERVEVAVGGLLFLLLLFGGRPQKLLFGLCLLMTAIVAIQHFFLLVSIADLGRRVDYLPASDPDSVKFWRLHGIYSGLEIAKMLLGFMFAARLALRWKPDPELFAREYGLSAGAPGIGEGQIRRG
jgi:hypothetical protein